MGSPPSRHAALEAPDLTPAQPFVDRMLNFAEFLLAHTDDWSKPQPFCPPPPPPLSFSGSERFIRGRLPHRTVAISASLSSLFSRDSCSLVDARDLGQRENASNNDEDVTHIAIDVSSAEHGRVDDPSQAPTTAHSETPVIPQENESSQNILSKNMTNDFADDRDLGHDECIHALNTKTDVVHQAVDEGSEYRIVADEQHISGHEVLAGKTGADSQPINRDQSISAMPLSGEVFHKMDGPADPSVVKQADDVEEGEIPERLPADDQLTCMRESFDQGEDNANVGNPDKSKVLADMQRASSFDGGTPDKEDINSEADEGMDEPISSFVSRCRRQLLQKREKKKFSIQDNSSHHLKKRTHEDMRDEECQHVVYISHSARLGSDEISGRATILQEVCSRDSVDKTKVDEAMGTPYEQLVHKFDAGVSQAEKLNGSYSSVINGGFCLSKFEAGNNDKLATQDHIKKRAKKCLTKAAREKKKREKQKANDRKIAKSGICKLKFKPYVEKIVEKQKKTCSFYIQGKCNKSADNCRFSHDAVPITKAEICKYFVMSHCLKGEQCPYSHSLSSFPCRNLHTKGYCVEGESCRFSHEPISEEAKLELLRKMEDERRARQVSRIDIVQDSLKTTNLGVKYNSSKVESRLKGKEAGTDGMQTTSAGVSEYIRLGASRKVPMPSTSSQVHAANKRVNEFLFRQSHNMAQPSHGNGLLKSGEVMTVESGGQLGAVTMSPLSPIAKTLERRTKAEAFLEAQLNKTQMSPGVRLATGSGKAECVLGSFSKEPVALPTGHVTSIRVSRMSALCRPNVNALNMQNSSPLETAMRKPLAENGTQVSSSPTTLLDMLLKPQGKAIAEEHAGNLGTQSMDKNMPRNRMESNIFLDRILR